MACKQSDLVGAINSYASARTTGDGVLLELSANYLKTLLDTLEYAPEEVQAEQAEEDVVVTE
jgi:hypothetical protein